ncbi:MAG: class I SAM-dependent methyltransferase [Armatimonadetes bacterium]|nr:class I SAM-dependent methyltransferase [Armatimonadota bacterium]
MMPHVCPSWVGRLLASPLRRLVQDPEAILAGLVEPGFTVLEVGPGMGFFTLPMARMVGEGGSVVAVDLQPTMLRGLERRAARAGLSDRVRTHLCSAETLGLEGVAADFALLFAVVHEVPDRPRLFAEVCASLKPGGRCLMAEPKGHVSAARFGAELSDALAAGFAELSRPAIHASRAVLLSRPAV